MGTLSRIWRPWCLRLAASVLLVVALALLLGGLDVIIGLTRFGARTVSLSSVATLTHLTFSDDAVLLDSLYEELPYGYLLARVQVESVDSRPLLEATPTVEWKEGVWVPTPLEGALWWNPSEVQSPRTGFYSLPGSGKSRLVRMVVPKAPTAPFVMYVWSIVD